ncbi:MAG: hypothetical protein ABIA63_09550 [bacterium]
MIRKQKQKTSWQAIILAVVIHVIVGVVFWQAGGKELVKDWVVEFTKVEDIPPKPPKRIKPPPPTMQKPPPPKVEFKVDQVDIKPAVLPDFGLKDIFDQKMGGEEWVNIAKNYDITKEQSDITAIDLAFNKFDNILKIGADAGKGRAPVVIGRGRRMSAAFTLTRISSPGTAMDIRASVAVTNTNDSVLISWDGAFKEFKPFESIINNVPEVMSAYSSWTIYKNTKTIVMDRTFQDWFIDITRSGVPHVDYFDNDPELTAMQRLAFCAKLLEDSPIGYKNSIIDTINNIFYDYIQTKYELDARKMEAREIIDTLRNRHFSIRKWREDDIKNSVGYLKSLSSGFSDAKAGKVIEIFYLFYKRSRLLNSATPVLFVFNDVGLSNIHQENMDILYDYLRNGGFIWVDDVGRGPRNYLFQTQAFVQKLINFQGKATDEMVTMQYRKLSRDDQAIDGYSLGTPFPEPCIAWMYIPISIPFKSDVSIKIFNRLGIQVKSFFMKNVEAGSYVTKESAFRWFADDNSGNSVESGIYFIQMESGLFKKTLQVEVSPLRKLDKSNPIFSIIFKFDNIPGNPANYNSDFYVRPYGKSAFGYYIGDRLILLYTEGAGFFMTIGGQKSGPRQPSSGEVIQCAKFFANVMAEVLGHEEGLVHKE